jgi:4-amino-4-deoxy-L-arabinose transferase-like glycosyltransferase
MLVDHEPEASVVRATGVSRVKTILLTSSAGRGIGAFVLFLIIVVALQLASGAYQAEFGGYPDEPAHYVTSLMVHDYVAGLNWGSPLHFAQQYYHHYPKVAFGHWPPFFYVVQATWMLLFSTSRASVRLEIAFTTAFLAYSVYLQCRRWFPGHVAPLLAGILTACIPLVQMYTDEEMSETLLTLLCFWAAVFFASYLDSGRWQDNLLFGIFFSLAVLTKGNGWLLAGIVPVAVLLTRKVRLVLRWQFWIAPAIVAALCLPWQLLTLRMAEEGWAGGSQPSLHYTITALGQFSVILLNIAGPVLGILALLGIVVTVVGPAVRRSVESGPAALFGLILATWIFHAIVPAGVEDRKMLIAVPALILFVFAGGYWLAGRIPVGQQFAKWRSHAVAIAAAMAFGLSAFAIPHQIHYGYDEVARFIASQPNLSKQTVLVSDDSIGEGLLISEIAMDERRPGNTVLRGTKALADVDWNATRYRSLYSTPEQVAQAIERLGVNVIVVDTFRGSQNLEHNELLREALQDNRRYQLIRTFEGHSGNGKGQILVYRVRRSA